MSTIPRFRGSDERHPPQMRGGARGAAATVRCRESCPWHPRRFGPGGDCSLIGSVRDPLELLDEVRQRIARVVPNVGGAWMLTDPQTLMPVSIIKDLQTPASAGARYFEHELLVPDFVPFADLHRDGITATTLGRATNGRPELSTDTASSRSRPGWARSFDCCSAPAPRHGRCHASHGRRAKGLQRR